MKGLEVVNVIREVVVDGIVRDFVGIVVIVVDDLELFDNLAANSVISLKVASSNEQFGLVEVLIFFE